MALDQHGPKREDGIPRWVRWRGKKYTTPTEDELGKWFFSDQCENPEGYTVDCDHPESWLRLLSVY